MTEPRRSWILFLAVGLVASFSIFILPFFFPPALSTVVSVSNAAGFNNKVSAVAAAACAAAVFFLFLWLPKLSPARDNIALDLRPISWRAVTAAALSVGVYSAFLGILVGTSPRRFPGDNEYFVNQISNHLVYHRELYSQIEFAYGPLLFYPPILFHALCRGILSIKQSFFVVLVLHQVTGIFLLAYLVNSFPMSRRWKGVALWCFAIFTLQPTEGPNYTLLRFALPLAVLVFGIRQCSIWRTALLFVLGQLLTLAVSAEMGFAFAAAAIFFSLFQALRVDSRWLVVVPLIPIGIGLFLFIVGTPYLLMFKLFAGGAYNFIVEPMPYMLLFLFGVVWLIPQMLAARLTEGAEDTALLCSCFVLSVALLPVALGRADPIHVFFNGLGIFLLSITAISRASTWQQKAWGGCFASTLLFALLLVYRLVIPELHWIVREDIYAHRSSSPLRSVLRVAYKVGWVAKIISKVDPPDVEHFDIVQLDRIVQGAPVATPFEVSPRTENLLKQHEIYQPEFYYSVVNVLDAKAEQRKVAEFNQAHWALLPTRDRFYDSESQNFEKKVIGSMLTYPSKEPFIRNTIFSDNLRERWEKVTQDGPYSLYRNVRPN